MKSLIIVLVTVLTVKNLNEKCPKLLSILTKYCCLNQSPYRNDSLKLHFETSQFISLSPFNFILIITSNIIVKTEIN